MKAGLTAIHQLLMADYYRLRSCTSGNAKQLTPSQINCLALIYWFIPLPSLDSSVTQVEILKQWDLLLSTVCIPGVSLQPLNSESTVEKNRQELCEGRDKHARAAASTSRTDTQHTHKHTAEVSRLMGSWLAVVFSPLHFVFGGAECHSPAAVPASTSPAQRVECFMFIKVRMVRKERAWIFMLCDTFFDKSYWYQLIFRIFFNNNRIVNLILPALALMEPVGQLAWVITKAAGVRCAATCLLYYKCLRFAVLLIPAYYFYTFACQSSAKPLWVNFFKVELVL